MEERYSRNRIYVSEQEQEVVRNTKLLFGGAGIGSIIAECALRFGFENITIIDGDKVELSNLNRQNYTQNDLGEYKAESLAKRLLTINPQAKIKYHTTFLSKENVRDFMKDCDIAVNALDFKDETPFVFDEICKLLVFLREKLHYRLLRGSVVEARVLETRCQLWQTRHYVDVVIHQPKRIFFVAGRR